MGIFLFKGLGNWLSIVQHCSLYRDRICFGMDMCSNFIEALLFFLLKWSVGKKKKIKKFVWLAILMLFELYFQIVLVRLEAAVGCTHFVGCL